MGNWIALFIFGILSPYLALFHCLPVAIRALKTGELEARGRSYFRDKQPKRFWAGIAFWFALVALSFFAAYVVIWEFFKRA
jgi:hypothetical protein